MAAIEYQPDGYITKPSLKLFCKTSQQIIRNKEKLYDVNVRLIKYTKKQLPPQTGNKKTPLL